MLNSVSSQTPKKLSCLTARPFRKWGYAQKTKSRAMRNFGTRLDYLLDREGMKDKDLAKMLDLSPSALSQWKNTDEPKITVKNLVEVSRIFGVRIDWLLNGTEPESLDAMPLDEDRLRAILIKVARFLSDDDREFETPRQNANYIIEVYNSDDPIEGIDRELRRFTLKK